MKNVVLAVGLIWGLLGGCAHAAAPPTACTYLSSLVEPKGGPGFLASYPTAPEGPLRGTAFLYDNAVAAIALVGCGDVEGARKIGDAIAIAQNHDRFWRDGRLRNAYLAGPVGNGVVKLAGRWSDSQGKWVEDAYQVGSDSGNMAWAMLALLALDRSSPDGHKYRDTAVRIGQWVAGLRDDRGPGGYRGGFLGWEPSPTAANWKSTEHDTDLAAAFALLAAATHDPVWTERARAAERFVAAMWRADCSCFATGTRDDGVTVNAMVALDAQIWPLLALPNAAQWSEAYTTSERRLAAKPGPGFTYSEAGDGLWTEGTAQAALLAGLQGRHDAYERLMAAVSTERTPTGGYYATDLAKLPTGFGDPSDPTVQRYYFHVPHLAAAAWAALAERGFNPFTATPALPSASRQ